MHYSEISNTTAMQCFAETVRLGWHLNPAVLEALKKGKTTPQEQAEAYVEVDEAQGLTVEDATRVIEYAMDSPEY